MSHQSGRLTRNRERESEKERKGRFSRFYSPSRQVEKVRPISLSLMCRLVGEEGEKGRKISEDKRGRRLRRRSSARFNHFALTKIRREREREKEEKK